MPIISATAKTITSANRFRIDRFTAHTPADGPDSVVVSYVAGTALIDGTIRWHSSGESVIADVALASTMTQAAAEYEAIRKDPAVPAAIALREGIKRALIAALQKTGDFPSGDGVTVA